MIPPPLPQDAYERLAAPIDGPTIRLVPLGHAHAPALYAAFAEDELWTYFTSLQPQTIAQTHAWIDAALEEARAHRHAPFVIETDDALAGTTRFLDIRPADGSVEIGWTMVFGAYRRSRLNTEAKYLLLRRAFDEVGFTRVQLKTDERNERSRAAIARIGAQFEGILRAYQRRSDGGLRNTAMFGITVHEWPAVKLDLEAKLRRA